MTPAAARAKAAVETQFGFVTHFGVYKRRPIAGTSSWSQHSWANGVDFHVSSLTDGDHLYSYLKANRGPLGIRVLLWRVTNHFDHIHADFWPKGNRTPPLTQLGYGWFLYPGGPEVRERIRRIPAYGQGVTVSSGLKLGAEGAAVRFYQEALNAWPDLDQPLVVDGKFGPATELAVREYQRAAELDETGVIGSPEDFLIGRYHPSMRT